MNLIRFAFYKMKLNELIKSGQNQASSAYLINKEVINKLKQIYKAKEIITLLSDSKQLDRITYENANQNFPKISKFLNDNKPEYINSFKDLEIKGGISFSNTEGNISLKRFNNNQNLFYVEDFEIIDNEFATFLSSKFAFEVNLMILPIIILPRENKIFTIITYKQNYIYEIVIPNNENIYKAEYILEILNNNPVTHDKKNLNNHILNVFNTYGIQKLIAQKSPFHTGNNIHFNLYPVNGSNIANINNIKNNRPNIANHIPTISANPFQTVIQKPNREMNINTSINNSNININKSVNPIFNLNLNNIKSIEDIVKKQKFYLIDKNSFEYLSKKFPTISENINNDIINKKNIDINEIINIENYQLYKEFKFAKNEDIYHDYNLVFIKSEHIEISKKNHNFIPGGIKKELAIYPVDIHIINNNIYNIIVGNIKSQEIKDKIEEIFYKEINSEYVLFKPKNKQFLADTSNQNKLIYLYSKKENSYEPKALLEFDNYLIQLSKIKI